MQLMQLTKLLFCSIAVAGAVHAQSNWPAYGGDLANTRYSALDQIDIQNVTKLAQAWVFDARQGNQKTNRPAQATPLVVNGVMYLVTAYQSVVALQPETGKQIWIYKHQFAGRPPRGIAYWPGDKTNPPEILFGTWEGLLIARERKNRQARSWFWEGGRDRSESWNEG